MEIATILKLAEAGVSWIVAKEKNKGLDLHLQLKQLKDDWYEEYNKPENERSNLALDTIRRKLLNLADTIAAAAPVMPTS